MGGEEAEWGKWNANDLSNSMRAGLAASRVGATVTPPATSAPFFCSPRQGKGEAVTAALYLPTVPLSVPQASDSDVTRGMEQRQLPLSQNTVTAGQPPTPDGLPQHVKKIKEKRKKNLY